ncbi:MAG TPA: DUF5781 family protein [Thermoplasmata archaeon]|nr:DUF5781 family protein [Thermoplasmata archaeon]
MAAAGYKLGDVVELAVDPKLPFMGYTQPLGNRYRIVVSGGSLRSGMLEGLIVHELSHIYRMETRHPSHDDAIVRAAFGDLAVRDEMPEFQFTILRNLINNVQDLYADDLAIRVMMSSGAVSSERMARFVEEWVQASPSTSPDLRRMQWENAWLVANNARALAQLSRHHLKDLGGPALEKSQRLLRSLGLSAREDSEYFVQLLSGMPEAVAAEEFRRILVAYLSRFLRSAGG